MQMSEATFTKHVYDKEKKRQMKPLEDFDPCPLEFRRKAGDRLPALLEKIRGENLCVSLLIDRKYRYWESASLSSPDPSLPNLPTLRSTVDAFMTSLALTHKEIRRIEWETVDQRYEIRHYRITASGFWHHPEEETRHPP